MDLYIPKRFSLLQQPLLEPFWKELKPRGSYWANLLVIILAFVSLGLFFCAYWSSVRPVKHPAVIAVVFGFAVSLTIEVLQSYLSTRSSGTTDLITSTVGSFLGVTLYTSRVARALLAKAFAWD